MIIIFSFYFYYNVWLFFHSSILESSPLFENRNRGEYVPTRKLIFEIESAVIMRRNEVIAVP